MCSFMMYLQTLLPSNQSVCPTQRQRFLLIQVLRKVYHYSLLKQKKKSKTKRKKNDMGDKIPEQIPDITRKKISFLKTTCCLLFLHTAYS